MKYIDMLFNRELVVTVLAAIAAFATIMTIAFPLLSGDRLGARLKSVATRREELRRLQREALNKKITEKGGDQQQTVREILRDLAKRYEFQIDYGDRAFKAVKMEPVADRLITFPPVENMPLKEVIQKVLDQAKTNARFEVIGDTIMILPPKTQGP